MASSRLVELFKDFYGLSQCGRVYADIRSKRGGNDMYQLKAIGKLYGGSKNEIEIQSKYRKALKRLDTFSHIHLFYVVSQAGEWKLETQIVEIEGVEIRSAVSLNSFINLLKKVIRLWRLNIINSF